MSPNSLSEDFLLPHIACRASVCYLVSCFFQKYVAAILTGSQIINCNHSLTPFFPQHVLLPCLSNGSFRVGVIFECRLLMHPNYNCNACNDTPIYFSISIGFFSSDSLNAFTSFDVFSFFPFSLAKIFSNMIN